MIPSRMTFALALLIALGTGVAAQSWPHAGPMPDDPVKVRPLRYESITQGTQNYRPVEPMGWDEVNRRVAPPGALPGGPPALNKRGALPGAKEVLAPMGAKEIKRDARPKKQ